MSTKLRREGSADASGTNIRKTVRLASDEVAQAGKATAATISRSNTSSSAAYGTNIGDAVVGEDSLSLITKISRLEKDLERRKESYVGREEAYKDRVTALEEELAAQNRGILQPKKTDSKLHELKAIQAEILESVELVQDRTARIMQEQERDLLRSFRARLFDVQTELEKEKSKKDDGLAAWRERFTQLEAELDWATEVSQRLDKVNATLTEENNELKLKFASQEQDRNLFIELLVSLKKDNALWRSKNAELIAENERLKVQVIVHLVNSTTTRRKIPLASVE
jgi:DNA repair exonuclease SbcCD ATPase subunit